jgi:hypothetical protein
VTAHLSFFLSWKTHQIETLWKNRYSLKLEKHNLHCFVKTAFLFFLILSFNDFLTRFSCVFQKSSWEQVRWGFHGKNHYKKMKVNIIIQDLKRSLKKNNVGNLWHITLICKMIETCLLLLWKLTKREKIVHNGKNTMISETVEEMFRFIFCENC